MFRKRIANLIYVCNDAWQMWFNCKCTKHVVLLRSDQWKTHEVIKMITKLLHYSMFLPIMRYSSQKRTVTFQRWCCPECWGSHGLLWTLPTRTVDDANRTVVRKLLKKETYCSRAFYAKTRHLQKTPIWMPIVTEGWLDAAGLETWSKGLQGNKVEVATISGVSRVGFKGGFQKSEM